MCVVVVGCWLLVVRLFGTNLPGDLRTFFERGKVRKPLAQPRHTKLRKKRSHDQGENLEDLHQQKCQQSAQQCAATNLVLGENLEDLREHHECQDLEYQWLGKLLLQRRKRHGSRHLHQLFRPLRKTKIAIHQALRDTVLRDLGHCDRLLG